MRDVENHGKWHSFVTVAAHNQIWNLIVDDKKQIQKVAWFSKCDQDTVTFDSELVLLEISNLHGKNHVPING